MNDTYVRIFPRIILSAIKLKFETFYNPFCWHQALNKTERNSSTRNHFFHPLGFSALPVRGGNDFGKYLNGT